MKKMRQKLLSIFAFSALLISLILPLASCTPTKPETYDYVSDLFSEYDLPKFDKEKFREAERIFMKNCAVDMPKAEDHAEASVSLYLEYYRESGNLDETDSAAVTDALLTCYVEAVGDRWAVYRNASEYEDYNTNMSGSFYGIGVTVTHDKKAGTVTVTETYPGYGAALAGILPGDLITGADGKTVSGDGYKAVVERLKAPETDTVSVTVLRLGEELSFTVTKSNVTQNSVEYSIDENKIGYIKISSFKGNTASQFREAIDFMVDSEAVGIVYDLRANPGGYLASVVSVLSYIAPSDTTITSFSDGYAKPKKDNDPHSLSLPSVVICNERTASAGELFTAALRDFDEVFGYFEVTTVGVTTRGKGVMQNSFPLDDGSYVTMTVAYYNPPSGENYDGIGIEPNVTVENDADRLSAAYEEIFKLVK